MRKVIIESVCYNCLNYFYNQVCAAFPDGIPQEFLSGENDHSEKHQSQKNNILFNSSVK